MYMYIYIYIYIPVDYCSKSEEEGISLLWKDDGEVAMPRLERERIILL
jgi:hypothetical protein